MKGYKEIDRPAGPIPARPSYKENTSKNPRKKQNLNDYSEPIEEIPDEEEIKPRQNVVGLQDIIFGSLF